jgi:hypothetical protein
LSFIIWFARRRANQFRQVGHRFYYALFSLPAHIGEHTEDVHLGEAGTGALTHTEDESFFCS